MEWDALNRLSRVYKNQNTPGSTGDDVLVAEYIYACGNHRMRKVVTNSGSLNGTTHYYYHGWRVVEERDGSDALLQQYTYGNYLDEVWTIDNRRSGITVAQLNDLSGNQRHFYHQNTLFHVYGLTDETGALKEAYQYEAYGAHTLITDGSDADTVLNFNSNDVRNLEGPSTLGSPYMFTGQRWDSETGIQYYKSRYYLQYTGRFLARDRAGYVDGPNLYEYALANPIVIVDPSGLQGWGEEWLKNFRAMQDAQERQLREKTQKEFDAWYTQAKGEGKWWESLDPCPCDISCYVTTWSVCSSRPYIYQMTYWTVCNPDPKKWYLSGSYVWVSTFYFDFHPGATYELRSLPKKGNPHGQQCMYDKAGKLITHGPGAGTADKVGPGGSGSHMTEDVVPFKKHAFELDGGKFGGPNMQKYWEVRPPNNGNNCPKNP